MCMHLVKTYSTKVAFGISGFIWAFNFTSQTACTSLHYKKNRYENKYEWWLNICLKIESKSNGANTTKRHEYDRNVVDRLKVVSLHCAQFEVETLVSHLTIKFRIWYRIQDFKWKLFLHDGFKHVMLNLLNSSYKQTDISLGATVELGLEKHLFYTP